MRDDRGRFAPGNRGGPGRPRGHREELRRAAEAVVTREHIEALMRRILRSGLEGNLSAAQFVWDRVCGKPTEAPPETAPADIELPELRTAADCMKAIDRLIAAIRDGTCERTSAKLLLDAIHVRVKAIEVRELEERLAELEQALSTVDVRTGPRRA